MTGASTIPYVAAWSSEEWAEIRVDPLVGRPAVFCSGGRGLGTPRLGKLNEQRQRECMMRHRCQVCCANLKGRPRFSLGDLEHRFYVGDKLVPSCVEPFTCRKCAVLSLRHCPGLQRARQRQEMVILDVLAWTPILQMVDPNAVERRVGEIVGGERARTLERLSRDALTAGGAVGYVKAGITSFHHVDPEKLS